MVLAWDKMCLDSSLLGALLRRIPLRVARQIADIAGVQHKRGTQSQGAGAVKQVLEVAVLSGFGAFVEADMRIA